MGDGLRIARDAAGPRLTIAQKVLLEDVSAHPGEYMLDASPATISKCYRMGWIRTDSDDPCNLRNKPWWLTRAGEHMLRREARSDG